MRFKVVKNELVAPTEIALIWSSLSTRIPDRGFELTREVSGAVHSTIDNGPRDLLKLIARQVDVDSSHEINRLELMTKAGRCP